MASLKDLLTEKMEDYALEPGAATLDLVLFHDALLHVCRIHRILSQPRGNALLVGVGGSGRKSLARLAAFVAELKVFSIEITRTYRHTEFREDLKGLYRLAGVTGKPTLFLFDETQVGADESCMEQSRWRGCQPPSVWMFAIKTGLQPDWGMCAAAAAVPIYFMCLGCFVWLVSWPCF
jgi:hypothetical protein